jgi:hypothetical protein
MDISRMTAFNGTGFFDMTKVARVANYPFMPFFFGYSQGIAEMAGGTSNDRGIVSRIEFFILMTAKAHIDTTGTGHVEFVRAFYQLLGDNEPDERTEKSTYNKEFQNIFKS